MTEVPVSHEHKVMMALEDKFAFLKDMGFFTRPSLDEEINMRMRTMPSNFSRTKESAMESLMIQVARKGLRATPIMMAILYDKLNGTDVRTGLEVSIDVIDDARSQRRRMQRLSRKDRD